MKKTKLEKVILDKLSNGELDGKVGDTFVTGNYKNVYYDKFIKDGTPISRRESEGTKYFDGKENVRKPGKIEDTPYETDEQKLGFFQRYGWLMDDPDVKEYSAKFKPKK